MDSFDMKILAALQKDARLTNQELSDKVALSASQCSRRRSQLEKEGVIKSYKAILDREKTGFGLTVIVDVMLNTHSRDNAKHFAELVNSLPQIEEAYSLTGEMDYQLKLSVRNLSELSSFINDALLPHASVQTVKSAIVLQTLKEAGGLPLGLDHQR